MGNRSKEINEHVGLSIKKLRLSRKLTQNDIANYINKCDSTVRMWELGKSEPDNDTLLKLADFFGVSIDYLLGRENAFGGNIWNIQGISPISTQKVPMIGEIACGKPIYANEDKESYIQAGIDIKADFCLTARGDSMINARIHDGDIVFCRAQNTVENGEIGVVIIGDGATLKRVFFYPEKKKLVLQAENPQYEPLVYINEELDEIRIIGKAIAFQSDVK